MNKRPSSLLGIYGGKRKCGGFTPLIFIAFIYMWFNVQSLATNSVFGLCDKCHADQSEKIHFFSSYFVFYHSGRILDLRKTSNCV